MTYHFKYLHFNSCNVTFYNLKRSRAKKSQGSTLFYSLINNKKHERTGWSAFLLLLTIFIYLTNCFLLKNMQARTQFSSMKPTLMGEGSYQIERFRPVFQEEELVIAMLLRSSSTTFEHYYDLLYANAKSSLLILSIFSPHIGFGRECPISNIYIVSFITAQSHSSYIIFSLVYRMLEFRIYSKI